jgi:hypothetical protein
MEKAGFIFNGFKAPNLLVNDDYKIEIFVLKCSGIYYNVVLYKKVFICHAFKMSHFVYKCKVKRVYKFDRKFYQQS